MFGYIVVNQPEMKIREYDRYHAYYCGVCRDLRAAFGPVGQMTLSYDLTFLAILLTALYEPEETLTTTRCLMHPAIKHRMLRNEYTRYAAEMNVLLAYFKAEDDRLDEHRIKGASMQTLLRGAYRKIVQKYTQKETSVREALDRIHAQEAQGATDVDLLAGCFGEVMRTLFVYREDEWSGALGRLGFYLGKYIYLLDAWDDIGKDIAKGSYNPLRALYEEDRASFDEKSEQLLTMMISACAQEFEALPILRDAEILRNILYAGVWTRFRSAARKKKQDE